MASAGQISRRYNRDTSHSSDLSIGKRNSFALTPRRAWKRFSRLREDSILSKRFATCHANRRLRKSADFSAAQRCASSTPQFDPGIRRVCGFSRIPPRVHWLTGRVPVRPFSPARPQCGEGARYLRANGWNPLQRTVWQLCVEPRGPPDADFVDSRFLPAVQFQHPSNDLDAEIARLIELDPIYISIYPSNLDLLLRVVEKSGQKLRSLRLIFTGSECVDDSLRERTRCFSARGLLTTTGRLRLSSRGSVRWACYHVNAEHVLIENRRRGRSPGQRRRDGQSPVTTLENYLMPLIRYEIGDYAVAAANICGCGRTLPLIGRIARSRSRSLSDGRRAHVSPYDLIS